jgi:hypothetical protein
MDVPGLTEQPTERPPERSPVTPKVCSPGLGEQVEWSSPDPPHPAETFGPFLPHHFVSPHSRAEENPPAPEPAPAVASTDQPSTRGGQRGGRGRGGPRSGKYPARGGPRTSTPREGAEDDGADESAGKKGNHL